MVLVGSLWPLRMKLLWFRVKMGSDEAAGHGGAAPLHINCLPMKGQGTTPRALKTVGVEGHPPGLGLFQVPSFPTRTTERSMNEVAHSIAWLIPGKLWMGQGGGCLVPPSPDGPAPPALHLNGRLSNYRVKGHVQSRIPWLPAHKAKTKSRDLELRGQPTDFSYKSQSWSTSSFLSG